MDFIDLNNLDQLIELLDKDGVFNDGLPERMKNVLFISGFSSTLKTTIVNKLSKSYHTSLVTSPVKIIDGLNHYYFKDNPLNAIHYFYSQFYAFYTLKVNNPSDSHYIVERFLWDHYYFLKRFNYLHCTVNSLDEFDVKGTVKRVLTLLDIVDNYKVLILKNDSPKLQNIAINSGEPTRRMTYSTVNDYCKYQDEYLECIIPIINQFTKPLMVSINDKLLETL